MKELEQYIRSHASEFDVMEPLPGHEERFLARLEQAQKPARRPWRIVWGAVAVAASLSALLFVTALRRSDPEAIYLAYMDEVSQLYAECPADAGADWDEALASLKELEELAETAGAEVLELFLQSREQPHPGSRG